MIVTTAAEASPGRMRPLDPVRDLRDVARLIGDAFAGEMDERGRAALRELRWMARLSPLVWWLSQVDPEFRDAFRGFVWEVRGKVVANVNLNRAPGHRQSYIICNVVVAQEYRNQGIARRLTEAAIAEADELGAQGLLLQVYRDNRPALHLYLSLNFRQVGGETELWSDRLRPVAVVEALGYDVRPWQPGDGTRMYDIARRAVPTPLQWIRPLRLQDYWPDGLARLLERVSGSLLGRTTYRLVAARNQDPVALLAITADWRRGAHHLSLLVAPEVAGQVEAALISRALHVLAAAPPRPVRVSVDVDHKAAIDVLRGYGFSERRTLLTMRRDLA